MHYERLQHSGDHPLDRPRCFRKPSRRGKRAVRVAAGQRCLVRAHRGTRERRFGRPACHAAQGGRIVTAQAAGQPRRIELQAGEYYLDRPVGSGTERRRFDHRGCDGSGRCALRRSANRRMAPGWRSPLGGRSARREGTQVGLSDAGGRGSSVPPREAAARRDVHAPHRIQGALDEHHRRRLEAETDAGRTDHDEVPPGGLGAVARCEERRSHGLPHVGRIGCRARPKRHREPRARRSPTPAGIRRAASA